MSHMKKIKLSCLSLHFIKVLEPQEGSAHTAHKANTQNILFYLFKQSLLPLPNQNQFSPK